MVLQIPNLGLLQDLQTLPDAASVTVCRYEVGCTVCCCASSVIVHILGSFTFHKDGQVYNERIYDLLNDGIPPLEGWRHLELKEDGQGCVFVEGLKEASYRLAQPA